LTAELKPGVGKHTLKKLKEIAGAPEDSKVSYARRVAAVQLLECLKGGRYGVVAFYRLLDRLCGYPAASLSIDGNLGVDQKRVVIVENFAACSLLDKSGRNVIQSKDGYDVIQVDDKYLDGGVPVPQATSTNLLPPP